MRIAAIAIAGALGMLSAHALAQDALRGKRVYLDTARLTGSTVSCVDCHGGFPPGLFGIGQAANNPARVANAIASIPQMTPLRGRLSTQDVADVAAYLGNPAVPSPTLRVGPGDRLDFGAISQGQTSARGAVTLTNTGTLSLTLTSNSRLTGPQAAEYSIADSSCTSGRLLAPSESCEVGVLFRPPSGASGLRTAALQVDHDWVSGTAAVALIGTAESGAANPPVGGGSGGGGAASLLIVAALLLGALARSTSQRG